MSFAKTIDPRAEPLRQLCQTLRASNAFYRRKLDGMNLGESWSDFANFTDSMPFTTKDELVQDQLAHPPFGTNLTFPLEAYSRCHQTSGTTGVPLRWLDTPESWSGLVDDWIEVYRAAEISRTDRIYFAFSFGPFLGFWLAFDAGTNIGCLCFPGGGLSSLARLRAILENGVTVICCTPTYALRLAEVAAENGLNLASSSVRTLIVAGEPGGSVAALRRQISERWNGARVCDHHGMTEVGPVSYECPATPRLLHVMDHSFLVESVNPQTGKPAAVGEVGELILTTLKRSASPLLRYRTGDLVQISAAGTCACGRSLTGLRGGILGRLDDMVVVRGVNVYPSAVDEIVRSFREITEYQVRLIERPSRVEMELEIELAPDCDQAHPVAERLAGAMSSALSLRVPIRVAAPGSLPRFELKARRWQRVRMS